VDTLSIQCTRDTHAARDFKDRDCLRELNIFQTTSVKTNLSVFQKTNRRGDTALGEQVPKHQYIERRREQRRENLDYKIMDEEKEFYSLNKKVWEIFAPFYDIAVIPISRVRDKVVNFTDARKGSKILDIATGTGRQAFAFAKKGFDVTGIDISEAMLKVANKKNKYGNARFEVADATNLPFEDNSLDVSCVSFALHDMPLTIREKALKEMARVTKANGTVVIVDYALPKKKISRFLIYHFVRLYEGEHYSNFIKADLEALLKKSGIEVKEEFPVLLGAGRIIKGTPQVAVARNKREEDNIAQQFKA